MPYMPIEFLHYSFHYSVPYSMQDPTETKFPCAVCSFCLYLAYSSIMKNLVSYLTKVLQETNLAAAKDLTTWQGTSYLAPLVGAFLADSYLGKYRTALIFCTIFFLVSATNNSYSLHS
jgi:dipeptide/tripeptide permease